MPFLSCNIASTTRIWSSSLKRTQTCYQLGYKLTEVRKNGVCPWLRPDGKTQVTVEYKKDGGAVVPLRVHTILISTQHNPDVSNEKIAEDLMEHVIKPVVSAVQWVMGGCSASQPASTCIACPPACLCDTVALVGIPPASQPASQPICAARAGQQRKGRGAGGRGSTSLSRRTTSFCRNPEASNDIRSGMGVVASSSINTSTNRWTMEMKPPRFMAGDSSSLVTLMGILMGLLGW